MAGSGRGFGGQEEAAAVDVVLGDAPGAVVAVLAEDLAVEAAQGPEGGVVGLVGPGPLVVGGIEVGPFVGEGLVVPHQVERVVGVLVAVPGRDVA